MNKDQFTVSYTTGKTHQTHRNSLHINICLTGVAHPCRDYTMVIRTIPALQRVAEVSSLNLRPTRHFRLETIGEGIIQLSFTTPRLRHDWIPGTYQLNLYQEDLLTGQARFELPLTQQEKTEGPLLPPDISLLSETVPTSSETSNPATPPTAEQRLKALIGLEEVKREVLDAQLMVQFRQQRQHLGIPSHDTENRHHMLFLGNPGTGKTTVAQLIGEMYHQMGILSKGHTIITGRAQLVGEYIGDTESKMNQVIQEARGGVLFIDEAYTLFTDSDDKRDYGNRVLESLLTLLSEPNPDCIIILAGYEHEMKRLLSMNPGLKDRFPTHLHFQDFTARELYQIACTLISQQGYRLSAPADQELQRICRNAADAHTPDFGNARWVHNLFQKGITRVMARRVLQHPSYTGSTYAYRERIGLERDFTTYPGGKACLTSLFTVIQPQDILEAEKLLLTPQAPVRQNHIGFC